MTTMKRKLNSLYGKLGKPGHPRHFFVKGMYAFTDLEQARKFGNPKDRIVEIILQK